MRIAIAVTNDLSTDQRVQRTISTLKEMGAEVTFIGRELPQSSAFTPGYETVRFRLPFTKGPLFYASYNVRLFFFLLFRRFDAFLANDADTLLAMGMCSRLKRVPLVYDSHEFFTGVPEIQHKPFVVKVWKWIESTFYHRAIARITVNDSIAELLRKEYKGELPYVVRNIGLRPQNISTFSRSEVGIPEDVFVVINQGAGINVDRGMEEALEAVATLDKVLLFIVGNGDVLPHLKSEISNRNLEAKVKFIDKVPYAQLLGYTAIADAGLSLDKPTSINYQFSLPNKLFDYIHSNIPVIASQVVEVKKIVQKYDIGLTVDSSKPEEIALAIATMRDQGVKMYQSGLRKAQEELTWSQERKVLEEIFTPLIKVQK